jgi:hypothetical protein
MAQALEISELDCPFLLRQQPTHQRANAFDAPPLIQFALVLRRSGHPWQFVYLIFTAALAFTFQSKVIKCTVPRQRQKPRYKWAALGIVGGGVPPKLQENVLNDLFRCGRLLENAQDECVHMARVAVVEMLEGVHVLPKKALHQRRVERHFNGRGADPQICQKCQEHRRFFVSYLKYVASSKADEATRAGPGAGLFLTDSNGFGNFLRLLDARADGGAAQIISHDVQAWNVRHVRAYRGDTCRVAEIVLWDSSFVGGDAGYRGARFQAEQGS